MIYCMVEYKPGRNYEDPDETDADRFLAMMYPY